jgi:predicted O-linked N-acetylglucosamine transferase (SPINDLY family)
VATAEELFVLGVTAHQTGDLEGAERYYRELIAVEPTHAPALSNLASLVARRGGGDEADAFYARAIAADPDFLDARFNRGNLLRRRGRFAAAVGEYEEVLRRAPDHPHTLLNLGLAVSDAGDWTRAAECFGRAAQLDPDLPDALMLCADALLRTGRPREAAGVLREAARRFPDSPRAHFNFGLQVAANGAFDEAKGALERALALKPDYAEAHNALGVVFDATGETAEALARYREAVRLKPEFVEARTNLGANLCEQGLVPEGLGALRRALSAGPNPIAHGALMGYLPFLASAEHLWEEARAWAAAHAAGLFPADPPARRPRGPRVRLGYLFGEMRARYAVALLDALLARHDRSKFHVTVYASPVKPVPELDALRGRADAWRAATGVPDERLAATVRADEIDVLIDLTGHAPGGRLLTLARKPAPVQIALLSEPVPTGLHALDYRVTDATADPPRATPPIGEQPLRLPDVSWVYVPPTDAPAPNARPATEPFTFGCLDHPAKLSDKCVETWSAVLAAVPNSRIVLACGTAGDARRGLLGRFAARGVAAERVTLVTRAEAAECAAYRAIDLALDPFPCGGAAVACDALWMGVPVLTVNGTDPRGRQTASVLTALGLPEFVADSREHLVPLAATWAQHRGALADLRAALRDLMRQSPVTDAAAYVTHLEAALLAL